MLSNIYQKRKNMSNTISLISAAASVAASAMLIRTITNEFVPLEVTNFLSLQLDDLKRHFSSQLTIVIEEFQGVSRNQVYEAAELYLGTKGTLSAQRVTARKSEDDKNVEFNVDKSEEFCDDYEGVVVKWKLNCSFVKSARNNNRHTNTNSATSNSELKSYELSFHKKHKEIIFISYLPYILERAKIIKQGKKSVKLNILSKNNAVKFGHTMNFKTLAIDSELKREIIDDLDKFLKGKEFYERTGKAWKRGYLLYGPSGTGKTSLIAAMANYLNYDIYDLDLKELYSNMQLKTLIRRVTNRSILVIEGVDSTIGLQNREEEKEEHEDAHNNGDNEVTLSGLLNAIDGLWSCCGEERIIVFTTNHKDRLDPALLRPGRMDMHIHLSYCTFSAFEQLSFNYLGITHHKLFQEIEVLLGQVQVTPAEVAGELTKYIDAKDPLQDIVEFLHFKKLMPVPPESGSNESYLLETRSQGYRPGRPRVFRGRGRRRWR